MNKTINTRDIVALAEEAGVILLQYFQKANKVTPKDEEIVSNNFVTEADLHAEEYIISQLRALYPSHALIAEETEYKNNPEATVVWHIDPLDGTVNFSRGSEQFAVSIAAVDKASGEVIVGVIHAPALSKTYFADSTGSFLKTSYGVQEIHVKSYDSAHLLTVSFSYDEDERLTYINGLPHLITNFGDIRHTGCTALNLCYIAEGRTDALLDLSSKTWDYMAGKLIAQKAGLVVDVSPNPRTTDSTVIVTKVESDRRFLHHFVSKLNGNT